MKFFLSSFLLSVLLTGCAGPSRPPVDDRPVDDVVDEVEVTLQVGLVALEDNGANGPLVGCGDSIIFVTQTVPGPLTTEERIQAALEALFAIEGPTYGESGLYTALDASTITVDSIHLEDERLDIELTGTFSSGGVCDDPRIVEQIKETAKNNAGLDTELTLSILVNGEPLEQQLSGK